MPRTKHDYIADDTEDPSTDPQQSEEGQVEESSDVEGGAAPLPLHLLALEVGVTYTLDCAGKQTWILELGRDCRPHLRVAR